MAIEFDDGSPGYLGVRLTGKLTAEDYAQLVPRMEALVAERGSLRLLLEMHDFHGWEVAAMWADTKFAMGHYHDIERIAMVGEKSWQHGMALFCKPFTKATVRYFDVADSEDAQSWISSD